MPAKREKETKIMTTYAIEMSRHQAALFLAGEFGLRGSLRMMRGLKPFGDSSEPVAHLTKEGPWYRFDTSIYQTERRHTKKCADSALRRAAEFIAYQEGRLGKPLSGSAGIMRVVSLSS
jgi:hypothetical protein